MIEHRIFSYTGRKRPQGNQPKWNKASEPKPLGPTSCGALTGSRFKVGRKSCDAALVMRAKVNQREKCSFLPTGKLGSW